MLEQIPCRVHGLLHAQGKKRRLDGRKRRSHCEVRCEKASVENQKGNLLKAPDKCASSRSRGYMRGVWCLKTGCWRLLECGRTMNKTSNRCCCCCVHGVITRDFCFRNFVTQILCIATASVCVCVCVF